MAQWHASRLNELPPYLFVEIDKRKNAAIAAGKDVIDFGVGDPDKPTPEFIIAAMQQGIHKPSNHVYSLGRGSARFRQSIASYFQTRFGVGLDYETEALVLLGSKEGIGHLPTAVINAGDVVLVPEPGYPVYVGGTVFAGGDAVAMPLQESNGWLPRLDAIPAQVADRARLMFLNYPNNPTAACATLEFLSEVVAFAKKHELLVAQDAAYADLYFDEPPPSILQVPGAMDVAVEFHSLSKTFNMTGWRAAFVVGNKDVLNALAKVKSNLDSGVFGAVQEAAIVALDGINRSEVKDLTNMYRKRRDLLVTGLIEGGWPVTSPQATFYVWAKCPPGVDSMTVATRALEEASVVVIPGAGLGASGEGFVRFSLTQPEDRIQEAVRRLSGIVWE